MEHLNDEEQRLLHAELSILYERNLAHRERFGHRRMAVLIECNRKGRIIKAILKKLGLPEPH